MIHENDKYNVPSGELDKIIPKDEPVFLLRGTDPQAYATVMRWLDFNRHEMTLEKIDSVMAHAERMRIYWVDYFKKKGLGSKGEE